MVDIDNPVLRDRRVLAEDGLVAVFIAIDHQTGRMVGEPDIQARGFIYESEQERIIKDSQKRIAHFTGKAGKGKSLHDLIKSGSLQNLLRDFLFERTHRRPIIVISVIEV